MSEHFTIHRASEGPGWPFGAGAVAAGSALLGGLIGLVTPMVALDWAAYQLYLDQVASMATPPLGFTAKLIFTGLMALLVGALGYAIARWAGVRSTGGLGDLLARLRGTRPDDDEDAPRLRREDRHPDTPARRPLSAHRDLSQDREDDGRDTAMNGAVPLTLDQFDDDEDELLLMSPMAMEPVPPPLPPAAASDTPTTFPILPVRGASVATPAPLPVAQPLDEEAFFIEAPHADDWNDAPAPVAMASASLPDLQRAAVAPPAVTAPLSVPDPDIFPPNRPLPDEALIANAGQANVEQANVEQANVRFAQPTRTAAPPPLDLSIASLDQLIARVEAGVARRQSPVAATTANLPAAPLPTDAVAPAAPPATPVAAPPPIITPDDAAFPNDPALAAALATLRRMAVA